MFVKPQELTVFADEIFPADDCYAAPRLEAMLLAVDKEIDLTIIIDPSNRSDFFMILH